MLLTTLIFFLPCLVSALWVISFLFKVKSPRQKLFTWMLIASSIYYASYATFISPSADYATMVRIDTICIPTTLALMTMMSIYLHMHIRRTRLKMVHLLMFAPAAIIGAVVNMLYYIMGFDNAERFSEAFDKAGGMIPAAYDTEIYRLYIFFDETVFNAVGMVFIIIIMLQAAMLMRREGYVFGDAFRFFFKGKATKPSRAIALMVIAELLLLVPLATMGRTFMMNTPILGASLTILVAIVKHCMCHVEFFSDNRETVTLYELSHLAGPQAYARQRTITERDAETKVEDIVEVHAEEHAEVPEVTETQVETAIEVAEASADIADTSVEDLTDDSAEASSEEAPEHVAKATEKAEMTYKLPPKMERMAEEFCRLMEEERLYRDDDLTLATLTERMVVGRTTLSMMIQQKFGKPFREVLNDYRVEAVKAYLTNNPTATQESVAIACGFKDASALNKKFKEATGMTPLIWVMQKSE